VSAPLVVLAFALCRISDPEACIERAIILPPIEVTADISVPPSILQCETSAQSIVTDWAKQQSLSLDKWFLADHHCLNMLPGREI
jgi:hypothetical protein